MILPRFALLFACWNRFWNDTPFAFHIHGDETGVDCAFWRIVQL
jgi:hypothetical protein